MPPRAVPGTIQKNAGPRMIKVRCSMLPRCLDCMRAAACGQFPDIINEAGYVLNEKTTGIYTAVGIGTHEAARYMLSHKITHGSLPPAGECIGSGIAEYWRKLEEFESVVYDDATPSQDVGAYQINVMTKAFYRDVAPRLQFPENATPENHLEMFLRARIGDDAELSGHPDIYTGLSIVDTKSGTQLRPVQTQVGGYINLLTANKRRKPENAIIVHLPRTRKDKVYPGTGFASYPVNFCANESWYLVNQVVRDVKNFIKSGNPASFQANPQSTLCSRKYCRAYGTKFCEYF